MIFDWLHRKQSQIEYIHPESVVQDSAQSLTTEDGQYDMTRFSRHEAAVIKTVIKMHDLENVQIKQKGLDLRMKHIP